MSTWVPSPKMGTGANKPNDGAAGPVQNINPANTPVVSTFFYSTQYTGVIIFPNTFGTPI